MEFHMNVGSVSASPAVQAAQSIQTAQPAPQANSSSPVDNDGDHDNGKDDKPTTANSVPTDSNRGRTVNIKA